MTNETEAQDVVPEANSAPSGPEGEARGSNSAAVAPVPQEPNFRRERHLFERKLSEKSDAFSCAAQLDVTNVPEFIGTVNCRAMVSARKIPAFKLANAVGNDGTIVEAAELYRFGEWLLVDASPAPVSVPAGCPTLRRS